MKYINGKIFLISLFVGLFLNYITLTPPKVIVIYPTQDNFNKIQYKSLKQYIHMKPIGWLYKKTVKF